MPAYISHAIMADDLYQKNRNDHHIFKIEIDLNELKTYSLGADLASISKNLKINPHIAHTKDFFLYMINNIKSNHLEYNSYIMALLYGHIMHYYFDLNAHPFIFYLDVGCKSVGFISNHHLIEGYLDSYLADKILNQDIMNIKASFFNQAHLNDVNIKEFLDNTYGTIYGDYQIHQTYLKTIRLFSLIEHACKCGLFSKSFLIKFSRFDIFMAINNLTYDDLNNESKRIFHNPFNNAKINKSFLEMYSLSINQSLETLTEINKYLYDKENIELEKIFNDLSYATGLPCSYGREIKYIKKR